MAPSLTHRAVIADLLLFFDPIAGTPRHKLRGQKKWCSPDTELSFSQPYSNMPAKLAVGAVLGGDHDDCPATFHDGIFQLRQTWADVVMW
jgi:hypothetical protein